MRHPLRHPWLFLPFTLVALQLHAQAVHSMADTKWGPAPPFLPAGAHAAVLQGDPASAGEYTLRLQVPDGYIVPPHYHPTDENVSVLIKFRNDETNPPLCGRGRADGPAGSRQRALRDHLCAGDGRSPDTPPMSARDRLP